jgi:type IV pilus assembly protein PilW
MIMSNVNFTQRRSQQGFGLIEIMIALLLGIIIMLGVGEIATRNSLTRSELERSGRQIESAAYALRLIETDLMSAGYWGEMGEQAAGGTLPPVCPGLGADLVAAITELVDAAGYPVQGQDALLSNCVVPAAGTDFLAIRRVNSCALDTAGCEPAGTNFHLQVNSCLTPDGLPPLPGIHYLVLSDTDALVYTQRDCSTQAPKYRFLSRVYYVNDQAQLVRAELDGSGASAAYPDVPLVDGIESLRFEYGLDNDGDGQVDVQTTTPLGTEWADVAMVRISLVVRNLEPTAGYADGKTYTLAGTTFTVPVGFESHRRQVYSRTVSLRNIVGRRG